jgi:hypothetical protein
MVKDAAMNLACATGSARGGRAQEQTRHSSYAVTVRSSLASKNSASSSALVCQCPPQ